VNGTRARLLDELAHLDVLAALAGETATRLWLASRQIGAVTAHRNRVPEAFQGRLRSPTSRRRPTTRLPGCVSAVGDRL